MVKGREEVGDVNVPDAAFDVPESNLVLPRSYLSVSQINMYMRCPKQYEFRYIRDEKNPPSGNLIQGTSGHSALETTHHHIVDHGNPASDEEVMDTFASEWNKKCSEEVVWDSGDDQGHMKDQGLALVRLYNKVVAPNVQPQVVEVDGKKVRGIEKEVRVKVEGVPMLGFIDLIDTDADLAFSPEEAKLITHAGGAIPAGLRTALVDFKFKGKSMTDAEANGAIQMTFYSYATGIHAIRYEQLLKQKVSKLKRKDSFRTGQDHAWLKTIVRGVAEAISAGVFPPTDPTSWVCNSKWCGYWHLCRGKKV
jgi:CRISPR/Cas system-associated exonuclease Cas4 (RecB family)